MQKSIRKHTHLLASMLLLASHALLVHAKGTNECTYDFVIIGAGIGGSVLAGRLTENPKTSVCLLEAGQDADDPLIPFPIGWPFLYFNARHDWSFWTGPLDGDLATRLFAWPRGKMLGGSSNHNAVQWSWGGKKYTIPGKQIWDFLNGDITIFSLTSRKLNTFLDLLMGSL